MQLSKRDTFTSHVKGESLALNIETDIQFYQGDTKPLSNKHHKKRHFCLNTVCMYEFWHQ